MARTEQYPSSGGRHRATDPRRDRRARRVAATVVAGALALVPAASAHAATGGGWGAGGGSGGGNLASAGTVLDVFDDFHSDTGAAGQGTGQASIDYFYNDMAAWFGSGGYRVGTQGIFDGHDVKGTFDWVCDFALQAAAERANALGDMSATKDNSRVVGVHFSYALGANSWFLSAVDSSEFLGSFPGYWADAQQDLRVDGNHASYNDQVTQEGLGGVDAVREMFDLANADAVNFLPYAGRYFTCVALNQNEFKDPTVDPSLVTDVPAADEVANVGEHIGDSVSLSLASGQSWPSGLSVKANGTLYGPFTTRPATADSVPAGAPVAGTASLTFDSAGTQSVTGPVVNTAGYYTWVWSVDKAQSDLLASGFTDKFALTNETGVAVFEPQVSTQVDNEFVNKGNAVPDKLTFTGKGWPKGLEVKATGTLYGPYDKAQAASGTVPAGAPVAGTATATATGPGTVSAGGNVTASKSGYYTWVWKIAQAEQTATADALIGKDFNDGFFTSGETSIVRARPAISSDVLNVGLENNEPNVVNQGQTLRDQVNITGESATDLWMADKSSNPITLPLRYDVYGPSESVQAAGTKVIDAPVLTGTKDVTNYGSYEFDLGALPNAGYYTVVWSIDTARLSAAAKTFLDPTDVSTPDRTGVAVTAGANGVADSWEVTDGTWAANETAIAPTTTILSTSVNQPGTDRGPATVTGAQTDSATSNGARDEATNAIVINKDGKAVDRVFLTPADPGDKWLMVGGSPTTVPMRVDLYGPFATEGNPATMAGLTPVASSTFVANGYTGEGTSHPNGYEVTFDGLVPEASGFYTAVVRVDTDALSDTQRMYLENLGLGDEATDVAWAKDEILAATLQFDLSSDTATKTISKGDTISDTVHVTRVGDNDLWPAPGGALIRVPMKTQVFGPFDDLGDLVHPDGSPIAAKVVAETRWVADKFGDYRIGDQIGSIAGFDNPALDYSGYYTIVTSVDTEALAGDEYATTRTFLDDRFETGDPNKPVPAADAEGADGNRGTDGYWSAGEQVTVRMAPVIETLRQDRLLEEKDLPAPLVDNVKVTLLDETYADAAPSYAVSMKPVVDVNGNPMTPQAVGTPSNGHALNYQGDLWLNVNGKPVEITDVNDAYGPYDTPQGQVTDPSAADRAKQIGTRWLTFTKSETQQTPVVQTPGVPVADKPAMNKVPAGGVDYATAKVDPNGLWVTPQATKPVECKGVFANPDLCEAFNPAEAAPKDTVTGFYTWESKIGSTQQSNTAADQPLSAVKAGTTDAYFEGFDSDFWVENETASVRDQITHVSRTSETSVDPGGRFFDDVRVGQFRDNHGKFLGLDATGWAADETTAKLTVYGPLFEEPDNTATAVPEGTPVYTSATLRAENGYWIVGDADYELLEAPMQAPVNPATGMPATRTWYVFTYKFDGDDRTTPFESRFGDSHERTYVDYTVASLPPVPGIDVEKASGGFPEPGVGNGHDADNNVATATVQDADNAATAKVVKVGDTTKVFFTVTNVGTETLKDVTVVDKTQTGPAIILDEDSFQVNGEDVTATVNGGKVTVDDLMFKVGDTLTFAGTLPSLTAGQVHGNAVTVSGIGVTSGVKAVDHDDWWATGQHPSIDIEKTDSESILAGAGNYADEPDNKGAIFDHDTEETAKKVTVGDESAIYFRVTNNGTENLIDVQVADTTIVGDKVVAITWDEIPPVLAPGASFYGRGVLPALTDGEMHGDEVAVTARGQESSKAGICCTTDTDGDGVYDWLEKALGTDPDDASSRPAQAPTDVDALAADADQDCLPDWAETVLGTDPSNPDTDGDGVRDGAQHGAEQCSYVGDKDQWYGVGVTAPTLTTQAQVIDDVLAVEQVSPVRGSDQSTVAVVGDKVRDYGQVAGQVPDDAFVEVARYYVAPDAQPVCTTPDWTSGPVDLAEDGSFTTEAAPTTQVGTETFVASVKTPGADGKRGTGDDVTLTAGDCGETAETVHVIKVSTERAWTDTDENGVATVADGYLDKIVVEGTVPAGVDVALASRAYKVPTEFVNWPTTPALDTAVLDEGITFTDGAEEAAVQVGAVQVAEPFHGAGTYTTDTLTLNPTAGNDLGALTWRHQVTFTGTDGERYVDGAFGETAETMAPVNFGTKVTGPEDDAFRKTVLGASLVGLIGGLVLLGAGVSVAAVRRKRSA